MRTYLASGLIATALAFASASAALAADHKVLSTVVQTCNGPNQLIQAGKTFTLTCDVVSPLGGHQMLILPEMYMPGNGCMVTTDKPRVIMINNNFGVTAKFRNRCGWPYSGTEGGLGWMIVEIVP